MRGFISEEEVNQTDVLAAPLICTLITAFFVGALPIGSPIISRRDRDADAESRSASRRGVLRGGEPEWVLLEERDTVNPVG